MLGDYLQVKLQDPQRKPPRFFNVMQKSDENKNKLNHCRTTTALTDLRLRTNESYSHIMTPDQLQITASQIPLKRRQPSNQTSLNI
jgi:hypothetical protein